jgi:sarcosine/dimethylglycine N-methyltransferase
MSTGYSASAETARKYYNSDDADNFYFHIWGGEDIHVGLYDSPDEAIAAASRRTVAQMASMLGELNEQTRVIDIGSGYAGSARYLAAEYGCRVTALNISEAENRRARSMVEAAGLSDRVEVIDGSFEQIPLPAGSVDVAWSQEALLHSGNRSRVLLEVSRVLRQGGRFIFTDPMKAEACPASVLQPLLDRIHLPSLGTIDFYRDAARQAGLREVEFVDLSDQLTCHYGRVREELHDQRDSLQGKVSGAYIERMLAGLSNWVDAGRKGYLTWGIMLFRKD